jgi:hypothetical protein
VSIGSRHELGERDTRPEGRPRKLWILTLAGLTGTFVVLACYALISSAGELGAGSATATTVTTHRTGTHSPVASASPASVTPARPAGSPAAHPLTVTSVTAFGPDGSADGDNPAIESRLLDVRTDQPWYSQWYATPEFGGLRSGTGLLLVLSEATTVRDVQLVLGSAPGADVQLRVGNRPSPDLPVVASASDVGGTVRLTATAGATGQYVLIWFTRLPADGHGHYQVTVNSVQVDG